MDSSVTQGVKTVGCVRCICTSRKMCPERVQIQRRALRWPSAFMFDAGHIPWEAHCGHALLWRPAQQCRQGGRKGAALCLLPLRVGPPRELVEQQTVNTKDHLTLHGSFEDLSGLRAVQAGRGASGLLTKRALSIEPLLSSCRQHRFYLPPIQDCTCTLGVTGQS